MLRAPPIMTGPPARRGRIELGGCMRGARIAFLITSVTLIALSGAPSALAAPSNDRLHNATTIASLPKVITQDTSDAQADGPRLCGFGNSSSVFFQFTPSVSGTLQADTWGSNYDTMLQAFTGSPGAFDLVRCNDDFVGFQSAVSFPADAGTTYYFMVVTCCGGSRDNVGGHLQFGLTVQPSTGPDVSVTFDSETLASGHKVRITGTVTCSQRVAVDVFAALREVRNDFYIARGSNEVFFGCDPSAPGIWHMRVDSETSVVFGPGHASLRAAYFAADTVDSVLVEVDRHGVTIGT
jgi:hypothetical protein